MKRATIVIGLLYGDEGKGTIVDHLASHRPRSVVVRFNGGSQAAHNVVTDDGRHHTFAQFGSGSFHECPTLLSRFMMIDPVSLVHESAVLSPKLGRNALDLHFIDGRCPIITVFHVAANRIREWMRGQSRHGSCGKGIGELASDILDFPEEVITAQMLHDRNKCASTLEKIQERKRFALVLNGIPDHLKKSAELMVDPRKPQELADSYREIQRHLNILPERMVCRLLQSSHLIMEGAQGVGLDEWHGFHPNTTWSTCTQQNAIEVLSENGIHDFETIGILRTYATRHGAGPFATEQPSMSCISPNENNGHGPFQGGFRCGHFDIPMVRYTSECVRAISPLDAIAMTHMDLFEETNGVCGISYQGVSLTASSKRDLDRQEAVGNLLNQTAAILSNPMTCGEFLSRVEGECLSPIKVFSYGPRTQDKHASPIEVETT